MTTSQTGSVGSASSAGSASDPNQALLTTEDPAAIEQAADAIAAAAGALGGVAGKAYGAAGSIRERAEWTGTASDAYLGFATSAARATGDTEQPLQRIAGALRGYAGSVRSVQGEAQSINGMQAAVGGAITSAVTASAQHELQGGEATAVQAGSSAAKEVSAAAGDLRGVFGKSKSTGGYLKQAHEPWDAAGAGGGEQAKMDQALLAFGAGDKAAAGQLLAMQQKSPSQALSKAINTAWQGMSSQEQHALITGDPHTVGALDGLPATARDQANRIWFGQQYAQVQKQAAYDKAHGITDSSLQTKLSFDQVVSQQIGQPGVGQDGKPPVYLLGFDNNDGGHVIAAFGNPDTANHVATVVPGVRNGFGQNSVTMVANTGKLQQQAQSTAAPGTSVSSICWLGYNAPPQLTDVAQVASTADANAAAPALDSFQWGLQASHQGAPASTTMIGHSYGSLTVGRAASRTVSVGAPGTLADRLAFVGSPGVGVQQASQLGVNPDNVWAGISPFKFPEMWEGDPIGLLRYPNDQGKPEMPFGADPASPDFGGKIMGVDPGKGHMDYFDSGSESLKNLGYLANGQTSKVSSKNGVSPPGPSAKPPAAKPAPQPAPSSGAGSAGAAGSGFSVRAGQLTSGASEAAQFGEEVTGHGNSAAQALDHLAGTVWHPELRQALQGAAVSATDTFLDGMAIYQHWSDGLSATAAAYQQADASAEAQVNKIQW
ncbi:MAG: hypothetical protein J2P25_20070 [Nocardiopsaceae bacterium]|nr:hypothetical protein [Nocardiopsaceae bacterium]